MSLSVEQNGFYPSEAGIAVDLPFVVVRCSNTKGATVAVQVSKDGGETWEAWPFLPVTGRFVRNHLWGYERTYSVAPGCRMRVQVSGYRRGISLWLETRT